MGEKNVKGLVLSGGGAKGSYQVGVYRALRELNWQPDIITGTSVGSLNGVLFASGKLEEAEKLWRSLKSDGVMELPQNLEWDELSAFVRDVIEHGGLDAQPLAERISELVDEDEARKSPIKFGLTMTRKDTLDSIQVPLEAIPQGELKDYLLASSACFPGLRPRVIDGVAYIDGGWRDNMPLTLAKKMGATELIGVDIEGIGITKPNTTDLPTRIIRSHWDLGPILDFKPERAARNIALGYFDTMRSFGQMGGTAYGILPEPAGEHFLAEFAKQYMSVLDEVLLRAPQMKMVEELARQNAGYPPVYEENPMAPTRAAIAPLELAAENLRVDASVSYTPRLLAMTVWGSFDKDPAERYPALLDGKEGVLAGECAMAAVAAEDFITAMVSRAIGNIRLL